MGGCGRFLVGFGRFWVCFEECGRFGRFLVGLGKFFMYLSEQGKGK